MITPRPRSYRHLSPEAADRLIADRKKNLIWFLAFAAMLLAGSILWSNFG